MPTALALVREILRSRLSADERRWLILDADLVLGLDLHRAWDEPREETLPDGVAALAAERDAARATPRLRAVRRDPRRAGRPRLGGRRRTRPGRRCVGATEGEPGHRRPGAMSSRPDQQVAAIAEAIEDPVEVALALPIALGLRQARVAAVLVSSERQAVEADCPPVRRRPRRHRAGPGSTRCRGFGRTGSARRAARAPRSRRDGTPGSTPRSRRRRRPARPRTCAGRSTRCPTRRRRPPCGSSSARTSGVTMSPVGSTLVSRRIETGPPARRRPTLTAAAWPSRSLVQITSVGRRPVAGPSVRPGVDRQQGGLLRGRRIVGDDHDRRAGRRGRLEPGQGAGEIVRPIGREQDHRGQADRRLVEPRRHAPARAVADVVAVGDVRAAPPA